jgi:4-hydroxy-tetrahydrodipicolinate synthase
MKITWRGVFPAVTTQFKKDQSLDLDTTARHLEALIDSGIAGLVMLGSLGENTALDPDEKRRVMELALKISKGRVPVLSGVAETSTAAACRYARDMEKLGADGLMVMPAMIYKADPRETIAHFRSVARSSGLPILVYNNPISYGCDITPKMFEQLAEEKSLVAIKESCGDVRRITDIFNTVGDRYAIFSGVDDLILEATVLGAVGWIAGVGLAFPRENQHLWELMTAGRWDEARKIYRWYTPLLHLDTHVKFVQYIKLAIQECGLGAEWTRAPRLALEGAEREQVLAIIRKGIEKRPTIPARSSK